MEKYRVKGLAGGVSLQFTHGFGARGQGRVLGEDDSLVGPEEWCELDMLR